MDRLCALGAKCVSGSEPSMTDIAYPLLGAMLIALMALYAQACARL